MKKPKLVMHNSVSLDGSFVGFESDIGQHYSLARDYLTYMMLLGSRTIVTGLETYDGFDPEKESDLPLKRKNKIIKTAAPKSNQGQIFFTFIFITVYPPVSIKKEYFFPVSSNWTRKRTIFSLKLANLFSKS